MSRRIFMGWDSRQTEAFAVAQKSLTQHHSRDEVIIPLKLADLSQAGLIDRRRFVTDNHGRIWDDVSQANCSTEFAITRFLTPLLGVTGWVLFIDCDVVFLDDINWLFEECDGSKAVMCVQHEYTPRPGLKMDGQVQDNYRRKNWSSVVLFNCDHPSNRLLSVGMIAAMPGRFLHGFGWLRDHEIGRLSPEWNWLVGEQPKPTKPRIAHFTLGGPWLPRWEPREHDEIWWSARNA